MKSLFTFLLLVSLPLSQHAQVWTWMHGTDTLNVPPVYGTTGVSAPSNRPGSLEGSACWTDAAGNFWMFGGSLYNGTSADLVNDLWNYNTASNEWKRVRGTGTVALANYGTQNVSAASNSPGGRSNSVTWTDGSGNLWMFGGQGVTTGTTVGFLNDLWMYNTGNNQWVWVSGSNAIDQPGLYGMLGTPSATNIPGGRAYAAGWISGTTLYVFGGTGISATSSSGYLSDLWTYNTLNGQWTYIKGSTNTYQAASHGTQGVPFSGNSPGCRSGSVYWKDNSNNFWIHGGRGFWSGFGACSWGDLWRYDPATNNWTWMKGSSTPFTSPVYGTQAVAAAGNDPGMREDATGWTDNNGDLWMFGGAAYYNSAGGQSSDTWKYNIATNQWTWMLGPAGIYGTHSYGSRFLPAATNSPPYRQNVSRFRDASGGMWMGFGSAINSSVTPSTRVYADLWRLTICSTLPASPAGVAAISNTICNGSTLSFTCVNSANPIYWYSAASNTNIGTGTSATLSPAPGVYSVFARTANSCTVSAPSAVAVVSVFSNPTISVANASVCAGQVFTLNPVGASSYVYSGGSQTVNITGNASYTISGLSAQGCPSTNTVICSLTVMQSPTVSVNSGTICAGSGFTFTPSGANIYTFSSGSALVYPTASISVYTITGGISNGCTSQAQSTVVVNPLPVIVAASNTMCSGRSYTIAAIGAASYTFIPNGPVVSPATSTSYSVIGTTTAGCKSSVPTVVNLNVIQTPSVTIAGPGNLICANESHSFQASGANSYLWFNGLSLQVLNISFAVGNPTISVTGTDQFGCSSTTSISLLVNECLGLNEQSVQATSVYPNPFIDHLQLRVIVPCDFLITDARGIISRKGRLEAGTQELDLHEFAPGIYFLVLGGEQRAVRIVKTE